MGCPRTLSKVHDHLLCLGHVQQEIILRAPGCQVLHLLTVGCLVIFGDQAHHHCVISEFPNDGGRVCRYTVVGVEGVEQWTESTALWGSDVQDPSVCEIVVPHVSIGLSVCL